jgi:hypothetical protein
MKLSKRKARKLITEERNTAKSYRRYGFKTIGGQEAKHAKFFRKYIR